MRPLLSRIGVVLWAALIAAALLLLGMHWQELSCDVTDRVLSTENLFLLAFIYPFSRLFHEFGHAYAVKRWGGEVHEMGVMLIVFMPLPYVDASWSSAFPEKSRRMFVGAAGIMVDIFLASAAIIVWVLAEPGAVRAVAYNVIFVAGPPPCCSTATHCSVSILIISSPISSKSPTSQTGRTNTSAI